MDKKTLKVLNKHGDVKVNFFAVCKNPDLRAVFSLDDDMLIEIKGSPVDVRVLKDEYVMENIGDVYPIWIVEKFAILD